MKENKNIKLTVFNHVYIDAHSHYYYSTKTEALKDIKSNQLKSHQYLLEDTEKETIYKSGLWLTKEEYRTLEDGFTIDLIKFQRREAKAKVKNAHLINTVVTVKEHKKEPVKVTIDSVSDKVFFGYPEGSQKREIYCYHDIVTEPEEKEAFKNASESSLNENKNNEDEVKKDMNNFDWLKGRKIYKFDDSKQYTVKEVFKSSVLTECDYFIEFTDIKGISCNHEEDTKVKEFYKYCDSKANEEIQEGIDKLNYREVEEFYVNETSHSYYINFTANGEDFMIELDKKRNTKKPIHEAEEITKNLVNQVKKQL